MKSKLSAVFFMLAGSFFLYCGETAVNRATGGDHATDASFVKDAKAQTSCGAGCGAPTFTKLWEGDLSFTSASTPNVQVGNYREVLLYAIQETDTACGINAKFRFDSSSPWATYYGAGSGVGILPILGGEMMLVGGTTSNNPCSTAWKYHVIIAGVL